MEIRRYCRSLNIFHGRVFNVSMFFKNRVDLQVTYVLTSLYSISCLLHVCMLCVLVFQVERSNSTLMMVCLSLNDIASSLLMVLTILVHVAGGFHYDFLPAATCRFIVIAFEVLPSVFNAISNYLIVALLFHRYFLLVYPLTFKAKYDKTIHIVLYIVCTIIIAVGTGSPCMIGVLNYPVIQVASKVDHAITIDTLLIRDTKYLCDIETIFIVVLIQKIVPVSICFILEIRCVYILIQRRKDLRNLTNLTPQQDVYTPLKYATIFIGAAFLLTDIPYLVALIFIVRGEMEEITTIYLTVNVFSAVSYIVTSTIFLLSSKSIRQATVNILRCRWSGR